MEKFGIEPALLLAQIINFAVFVFVFYKFVSKPLVASVRAEKKKQQERDRLLTELQTREGELNSLESSLKKEAAKERDAMLKDAKKIGETMKSEIVESAKKEADALITKTHKSLDSEREEMYGEIKGKTIDLSVSIVNKALSSYLTPDVQKKLTTHIVQNMSKEVVR